MIKSLNTAEKKDIAPQTVQKWNFKDDMTIFCIIKSVNMRQHTEMNNLN